MLCECKNSKGYQAGDCYEDSVIRSFYLWEINAVCYAVYYYDDFYVYL